MPNSIEGERPYRRLLWALSDLRPGDPKAVAVLQELDLVEHDIGDVALSCNHLLSLVATSPRSSGRLVVDEHTIPMPWRERFAQASIGSTRVAAGPYLDDLQRFVEAWGREMAHLPGHRDAISADGA